MGVRAIEEEDHGPDTRERLRLIRPDDIQPPREHIPQPPAPPTPEFPTREIVAVLSAIAAIIGARLVLLLGFAGALGLFYVATTTPSFGSIIAATLFALAVFWPIAWLSLKKG